MEDTNRKEKAPDAGKQSQGFTSTTRTQGNSSMQPCQSNRGKLDQNKLSDPARCITELNSRYAVVNWGGKISVLDEADDEPRPMSFQDFKRAYDNNVVNVGHNSFVPLGRYWLDHPNRRQYLDGVGFYPQGKCGPDFYNMWQGFKTQPDDTRSCDGFLDHLLNVICAGNRTHYEYLLNWLALLIQRPWELHGVAIVLLSLEGTGKGIFMRFLEAIVGRHYKRLQHKNELIGRFSGHLSNAVLVFADEMSWTDDKDAAGVLKGLITERNRLMERKHAEAITIQSCISLIIASNESWVVPAGLSDRRYFVLDVSSKRIGDEAYFQALLDELDQGGASGLHAYLLNRDISGFSPRDFPKTEARLMQQLKSLGIVERWLYDALCLGAIPGANSVEWPKHHSKDGLQRALSTWAKHNCAHTPIPSIGELTRALRGYGADTRKLSARGDGGRPWVYCFPELDAMREKFSEALGYPIPWPDSDS